MSGLDATWKLFTTTATAPAGTERVFVEFSGLCGAAELPSLYIDDIYVGDVEGTPPPATQTVTKTFAYATTAEGFAAMATPENWG